MKIHDLKPAEGSRKRAKRVGRGIGGKGGKTAGRGSQGPASPQHRPRRFRRGPACPCSSVLPKLRGFNNPFRVEYQAINLDTIAEAGLAEVTPEALFDKGLIGKGALVKVLGRGELSGAVTVQAHAFSKSAEAAITGAGGSIETATAAVRGPPCGAGQPARQSLIRCGEPLPVRGGGSVRFVEHISGERRENLEEHLCLGELRNKILFTLAMIMLYRLGVQIPSPGVNLDAITGAVGRVGRGQRGHLRLPAASSPAVARLAVVLRPRDPAVHHGVDHHPDPDRGHPQARGVAEPGSGRVSARSPSGPAMSRWCSPWCRARASCSSSAATPKASSASTSNLFPRDQPQWGLKVLLAVTCMTVGTAIVMWMGELIDPEGHRQRDVADDLRLGRVAGFPASALQIEALQGWFGLAIALVLLVGLIAGIMFVEQGQRRIPVNFAKRVVGRRQYGGNNTYIPLKVNQAGVIPVIFASSLLQLPSLLVNVLPASGWGQERARASSIRQPLRPDNIGYILVFGATDRGLRLLLQLDRLRSGATGRRIAQVGRIRAGYPARSVRPSAIWPRSSTGSPCPAQSSWPWSPSFPRLRCPEPSGIRAARQVGFSGVSILIAVGVALETMKQIDSHLLSQNYEGFLK